eukprot:TRINITY_DN51820_c0_g1_i1.p1 TRINITY_DN51820_c0_g1~~TRINITY_DN51820_c0_g1_i1.p1  ORF type:complete len:106 (-),score=8.31 TRINITY_DN51820_c0_g1_i1:431-748(-)
MLSAVCNAFQWKGTPQVQATHKARARYCNTDPKIRCLSCSSSSTASTRPSVSSPVSCLRCMSDFSLVDPTQLHGPNQPFTLKKMLMAHTQQMACCAKPKALELSF